MLERLGNLDAIRSLIDQLDHPVVVTRERLIVAVNESWLRVLGFERGRVEGQPYIDLLPAEERARMARRAELREQEGAKEVPFSPMTSLALKADGSSTIVHVQPTVIPAADGAPYVMNFLFVAPERDAEVELAELLVATSADLVKARTETEVRTLAVTQLRERGYQAAFFRPDGTAMFPAEATLPPHVHLEDVDEALRERRAVFAGADLVTPQAVVLPIDRGEETEVLTIAGPRLVSPLRAALRLFARGVGFALETTALIADLERRNDELSDTRAELVRHERLAALGEMAASVAHEVRNPVGVIVTAVSTLRRRSKDGGSSEELLGIVDEECFRLERMVRGLLDFARPRPVRSSDEALDDVACEAIAAVSAQPDPALRGRRFELVKDSQVPRLEVDRELLRQALVNLLVNAVQASAENEVVRVAIGVEDDARGARAVTISVADRGSGIEPSIADRIFDPFFTTRPQGTGLGLALVKRIVEALRAEISVESEPGRGTTFKLSFRAPTRDVAR